MVRTCARVCREEAATTGLTINYASGLGVAAAVAADDDEMIEEVGGRQGGEASPVAPVAGK